MAILPVIFLIPPLLTAPRPTAAVGIDIDSRHEACRCCTCWLIPALVPAALAAYSVVGEREQGTLEPVLTTPIRREEFLLGKALAVFVPALAISYAVFGFFLAGVALFAHPGDRARGPRRPGTCSPSCCSPRCSPAWSIWVGIAISARSNDIRVAQQLSVLASLPPVVITSLIAFGVIHTSLKLTLGFGVALLVLDRLGWRFVSALFDRERLISGTRS